MSALSAFRGSEDVGASRPYGRGMDFSHLSTPQRISAGAILVVALAAFLPWVSIFGISALGIEGDGVITLLLALAGGAVLAMTSGLVKAKSLGRKGEIALVVLAALVALIGLLDMNGAAAIGLYLTLFGGVAWAVAAVWQLNLTKQGEVQEPEGTA